MEKPVTSEVRPLAPWGGEPRRTAAALSDVMSPPAVTAAPSALPAPPALPVQGLGPSPAAVVATVAAATPRRQWMDILRGAAIVLVVVTHVRAQGYRHSGIDEVGLNLMVDVFTPVRIPLLMLLSGMLLSRSLAKGPRVFVAGKLRGIAWPYVVWSLIYLAVWRLVPGIDGAPHPDRGPVDIVTAPVSVLWYLHLLLGLYLVSLALLSIPRVRPGHLLTVAAAGWALVSLGTLPDLERPLCLATFFLGGDLLARRMDRGMPALLTRTWVSPARRRLTVAALLAIASPLLWWAAVAQPVRYMPTSLVPAAALMVLLAVAAHGLEGSPLHRPLAWIGRQSLVFYVAHWLVVGAWFSALGLVLEPAGTPYLSSLLVLAATVTTCAALARLQQRARPVGWLFAAPGRGSTPDRARVQG